MSQFCVFFVVTLFYHCPASELVMMGWHYTASMSKCCTIPMLDPYVTTVGTAESTQTAKISLLTKA